MSSPLSWDNWEAGQAPGSEDIVLLATPLSVTVRGERLIVNHMWFQWRLEKARTIQSLHAARAGGSEGWRGSGR